MFELGVEGRVPAGEEPIPFFDPIAATQDRWSRIYVLENGSDEVYRYNYLGEFEELVARSELDRIDKWDGIFGDSADLRQVNHKPTGKTAKQKYYLKDFKFVRKWLVSFPWSIDTAPDGSVYMAYRLGIAKYNSAGKLILTWSCPCFNVGVAPDGSVYVDIFGTSMMKYSPTGEFILGWGSFGSNPGQFFSIEGVSVAPDGSVYVAEGRNSRIQQFSPTGDFIRMWGKKGINPGEFKGPKDVAVAPDGTVYVADDNAPGQQFSAKGKFIRKWDRRNGYFEALDVAPDGSVFCSDYTRHRIRHFSDTGQFMNEIGSEGSDPGEFKFPNSVAVGLDGWIYVSDKFNYRIQQFSMEYTWKGLKTLLFGRVKGILTKGMADLIIWVEGTDKKGVEIYGYTKHLPNGKYKFKGFPRRARYTVKLLGYDSTKYSVKPESISGKAGKSKVKLKAFVLESKK